MCRGVASFHFYASTVFAPHEIEHVSLSDSGVLTVARVGDSVVWFRHRKTEFDEDELYRVSAGKHNG